MKAIYKIVIIFLIFLTGNIISQSSSSIYLSQSKLVVQSVDKKGKPFNAHVEFAIMTLNLANGDFTLSADLLNLKTGKNKLDSIILAQGPQPFMFKGNINGNLYLFNQAVNDEKEYKMEGQLSLNKNTIPCIAQYDPIGFGEKSEAKNYRMNFKLVIDATKITILGLENKVNNQVIFEVIDGQINTQP